MTTETRIALDELNKYHAEWQSRIKGNFAVKEPAWDICRKYWGEGYEAVSEYNNWVDAMEKRIDTAEDFGKAEIVVMSDVNFYRAIHVGALGSGSVNTRRVKAIEYYQKALQLESGRAPDIYFMMGYVHLWMEGKKEDAISCFQKVIELEGTNTERTIRLAKKIEELTSSTKGGCFIATVAFGSPFAPEVVALRRFRDNILIPSLLGRTFVRAYYVVAPIIAHIVFSSNLLKRCSRMILLRFVSFLKRRKLV